MSSAIKFRLVTFVLAIGGMAALIAWTAHSSWQRTGELGEMLTSVQLKSFQIADHFQETILELNTSILRFGVFHDTEDWAHFESISADLAKWIEQQQSILQTGNEKKLLNHIAANFDDYVAAARQIANRVRSKEKTPTQLIEFADFEKEAQRVLELGFELAKAHRESMNSFLAASNKSLTYLRILLVASLTLLMLAGGGLAVVVYGELIAPLQVKLVESQALVSRQEKLASLGMLAAGVAHEIRNPLTAIKAWLFIQQKHLTPGTPEHADAEIIAQEISRLERIVKEVLLFARPSEPQLARLKVDVPLSEVQTLLSPQLEKSNIKLLCENSVDAYICIDPQQMKQVLINLVQNAADSIGQEGSITLRARLDNKRLGDHASEVVILEVADTGEGIPPEVEKRLFDPFFTTKEAGTGLGLSIAARIVERHGGALQYQTQVNRGTTFGIVLPKA